ncbi:MAG: DUF4258 domain-containing protein [Candidatus Edwardsbacteria bacterium]
MKIQRIRGLIEKESYYFYTHCLIEAKKDDVGPEDILYCLLTGKIIEAYPERKRVLVYSTMPNGIPLHIVCDLSQKGILAIVTCYIPDKKEWIKYQKRKR